MAATSVLFLLALIVASCFGAAVVPTMGTPVTSTELGPDEVTENPKIADENLTVEQKTRRLQEFFSSTSDEVMGFLNTAAKKLAENAEMVVSDTASFIRPALLTRFRRSPDSDIGGSSAHHGGHHPDHGAHPDQHGAHPVPNHQPQPTDRAAHPEGSVARDAHHPPHLSRHATPPGYLAPKAVPGDYAHIPVNAGPKLYPAATPTPIRYVPSLYAPAHSPRPMYHPDSPVQAKTIPEIWENFITKPLQEAYYDFIAFLPVNAIYSLLFEHQYFDFGSLRTYAANKFGFITAMKNVFHAPNDEIDEIGRFFDRMTTLLPARFFGDGRTLDDLLNEFRLYFAVNYPLLEFLAPQNANHYYAK